MLSEASFKSLAASDPDVWGKGLSVAMFLLSLFRAKLRHCTRLGQTRVRKDFSIWGVW
jgi:hypothetical protein